MTLVMHIEEPIIDYCGGCQPLGQSELGVKRHRNIPLDVRWVRAFLDGHTEPRFIKICADCLYDAHTQTKEDIQIFIDGKKWIPEKSKMMFWDSKVGESNG
tara:strand:+ start:591 stop:893 length:303 start_codon:yes stop_codon:yes gene_type:complete